MGKKGLIAMLSAQRPAGVTPDVNGRYPEHADDKACKYGFHLDTEIKGRHHQKSKTGI